MSKRIPRALGLAAAGMVLLCVLSACTGNLLESKTPEPQVYVLRPATASTAAVAYNAQLSVGMPMAAPGLDSARIALLRNGNELAYFYGARWGGSAPQVVQAFLVALLQSQQGFKGVMSGGVRADADYVLDIELRDFQAEYRGPSAAPSVHVSLAATLIDIRARKSLGQLHADTSIVASDNRLSAVVSAFQAALQQGGEQLSEQMAATLNRQPYRQP